MKVLLYTFNTTFWITYFEWILVVTPTYSTGTVVHMYVCCTHIMYMMCTCSRRYGTVPVPVHVVHVPPELCTLYDVQVNVRMNWWSVVAVPTALLYYTSMCNPVSFLHFQFIGVRFPNQCSCTTDQWIYQRHGTSIQHNWNFGTT